MPATQILVLGEQGVGKSTAFENLDPKSTLVISPNAKPLPWAGSSKQYIVGKNRIQTKELTAVPAVLTKVNTDMPEIKVVLIEDLTHYFNARTTSDAFMARKLGNDAFARWGELANDVARVIDVGSNFRDDLTIVYNAHTEKNDQDLVVLLTPGKLLDRDIKPTSYFTYVFHALVVKTDKGIDYRFLTNKDGIHDAKTPKGCFTDLLIPNDMDQIIKRIKEYQDKQ